MGAESHLVPGRLAKGSRCFGAWIGHELVGYGWLSTKPEWIGEVQLEIAPAAREAYVWNCVTLAPHRRKGVFRSVVISLVAKAAEEGLGRLWIASSEDIGQNSLMKAGFVPVVRFDTTSRLGLRWLKVAPMDGVDPGLAQAAREAMSIKPGSSLRVSRRRRH
jgi:GNAT superfamily N-acetyltransferase